MATYNYRARDKFGKLTQGSIEANAESEVVARLREKGCVPIAIKRAEEAQGLSKVLNDFFDRFKGVKYSDLNAFTRQFFVLQRAGLPILVSLNVLREQSQNKRLRDAIENIEKDIRGGASLSGAMKKHTKVFSDIYISMIEVGEASGTLDEILERLAALGEHEEHVQMRIKAATRYPIIVIVAIVLAFSVLTTFVVPRFAKIFSKSGVDLPLPTQVLVWLNRFITDFWWVSIALLIIALFALKKFINTTHGRIWWDNLKLKVPVFGPLVLKLSMSRFTRIVGIMMRSGVPVLPVLDLASAGTGNAVISGIIDNIKSGVNDGHGLADSIRFTGTFPPAVVQMVSVGEKTGKLDELMMHVSNYYNSQAEYTIDNLTTLIEPMLLLVLGGGVLFMALGIFLPMWNLISLFKR
ncbi:MAG: type II secretion system F family protein [Candidatus Omnitrophota bacterium]|nr:MAG: type II secretion system F family protein [Candidatus Omnitrophota bacterium]